MPPGYFDPALNEGAAPAAPVEDQFPHDPDPDNGDVRVCFQGNWMRMEEYLVERLLHVRISRADAPVAAGAAVAPAAVAPAAVAPSTEFDNSAPSTLF